jgi:hypothetical protein
VLFMNMLGAAIASGEAHLAAADAPDSQPHELDDAAAWGWRKIKDAWQGNQPDEYRPAVYAPQGRRIGYVEPDLDEAQLIGPAAYAVAERMAAGQDRSLAVGEVALWRLLGARKLITRANPGRHTLRCRIGNQSPCLVCVRLSRLLNAGEGHSTSESREQREHDEKHQVHQGVEPFAPTANNVAGPRTEARTNHTPFAANVRSGSRCSQATAKRRKPQRSWQKRACSRCSRRIKRYEAGGADENADRPEHEGKPWADDPAEAHNWARTCEHPGCTNEAAVWGTGGSWCDRHFNYERYE